MKVGIIDDMPDDVMVLYQYMMRYMKERKYRLEIHTFNSSIEFLEGYRNDFDILFLDVEMPGADGLKTAREIREVDNQVQIIFVTNMAQYAVLGYEVNAIDFMIKPVEYFNFTVKLEKAMQFAKKKENSFIVVGSGTDKYKIELSDITYIEKEKNYLSFHTTKGIFRERGTMAEWKPKLNEHSFEEPMTGYLVNLFYVDQIKKDTVYIAEQELPISRRLKKNFIQNYINYIGGLV